MQTPDFIKEYESRTDDELLHLAAEPEQLIEEAYQSLLVVMHNRGIAVEKRIREFREEEANAKKQREKNVGRLGIVFHGIGRGRYGKSNYQLDADSKTEQFTTTIFWFLLWFPLIPIGTYRVLRKKHFLPTRFVIIEKLPFDWTQILRVWAYASVILLLLVWAIKLFVLYR
jgi:hypothetical protein